jgi:hypothetical protein
MVSPSEMKAAAVAASVRQAASALLPAEGEAAVSGAKVQPPGAAGSVPLARQPGEAEVASDAEEAQPPEEAEVASDAEEAQPPEEAEVASDAEEAQPPEEAEAVSGAAAELQQAVAEPDGVAGQLPAVAAEGLPDAEVRRRGAAEAPAPSARQPAAGRPSAARPSWRPGGLLPWLAPRRAVRSAHAMRRSRVASPSRQSWRAAGCEGLS